MLPFALAEDKVLPLSLICANNNKISHFKSKKWLFILSLRYATAFGMIHPENPVTHNIFDQNKSYGIADSFDGNTQYKNRSNKPCLNKIRGEEKTVLWESFELIQWNRL